MKKRNLFFGVIVLLLLNSCTKSDDNEPKDSNQSTTGTTSAIFNPNLSYGSMTDQDGNVYKTIVIGTQTWLAENIRTTKYNDGTVIPNVTEGSEWTSLSTGAYCTFKNTTNTDTIATFGRLYNWYAVNSGKLAPIGWHVPTAAEWTILIDYLGGSSVALSKMKEMGDKKEMNDKYHWWNNASATNESGFTGIPTGMRNGSQGTFPEDIYGNRDAFYWSSSTGSMSAAKSCSLTNTGVYQSDNRWKYGISVRLIKD